MNTKKEIKEIENKIKSLKAYCDANCEKDLKGEELTKLSNSIESLVFNEKKLKQLKLKLKKEKSLTLKIKDINKSKIMKVVNRERNYEEITYNFTNGFYPEKIEIMYEDKIVPLTFKHNGFYIESKSGGKILFNPFKDNVQNGNLYYTKERA